MVLKRFTRLAAVLMIGLSLSVSSGFSAAAEEEFFEEESGDSEEIADGGEEDEETEEEESEDEEEEPEDEEEESEPDPTDPPTPAPTDTPKPTPEPTAAPTDTPRPTPEPTDTPAPTAAPTNTPKPTDAPTAAPAPEEAFSEGYAFIEKDTVLYKDDELQEELGSFAEDSVVYALKRLEKDDDEEILKLVFAYEDGDTLSECVGYVRADDLSPLSEEAEEKLFSDPDEKAVRAYSENQDIMLLNASFAFAEQEDQEAETSESVPEETEKPSPENPASEEEETEAKLAQAEVQPEESAVGESAGNPVDGTETAAPEEQNEAEEQQNEAQQESAETSADSEEPVLASQASFFTSLNPLNTDSTEETAKENEADQDASDMASGAAEESTATDDPATEESTDTQPDSTPATEESTDIQQDSASAAEDVDNEADVTEEPTDSEENVQAEAQLYAMPEETEEEASNSEEAPQTEAGLLPVSFTPAVTLEGEGLPRSFTLTADDYNNPGAELGEKTQVTVQPGETAQFDGILFTAAGTYGFAILDDGSQESNWELTVVVAENKDWNQLYIDSTQTIYSNPAEVSSHNTDSAVFQATEEAAVTEKPENKVESEKEYTPVSVSLTAQVHATVNGEERVLPDGSYPEVKLILKADQESSSAGAVVPRPEENTVAVSLQEGEQDSSVAVFDTLTFTEPGTYAYTVEEIDESNNVLCYDYDDKAVSVVVEVTEDPESAGTLVANTVSETQAENADVVMNADAQTGSLTIDKICAVDPLTNFEFEVSISNSDIAAIYGNDSKVVKTFSLSDGSTPVTISDLPYGTNIIISESASAYRASFAEKNIEGTASNGISLGNNRYSLTIDSAQKTIEVTNTVIYATLNAQIYLYGTSFSSLPKSSDSKTQYIYPGHAVSLNVKLTAKDDDAPMPSGSFTPSGSEQYITKKITMKASGSPKTSQYLSALLNFDLTTNMDKIKAMPAGTKTFKYTISHSYSEQDNKYPFIDYDAEISGYDSEKIINVELTITKQSDEGEPEFNIIYSQDNSRLFPSAAQKKITNNEAAVFRDDYLSTVVAISKRVSGLDTEELEKNTDTFDLSLTLWNENEGKSDDGDEEWLSGWYFYCYARKSSSETADWGTVTSSSYGDITYTVRDGGGIYIYGVPNGVMYFFDEDYTSSLYYYPTYAVRRYNEDDESSDCGMRGTIIADNDGNDRIVCSVTNTASDVPETGYGDPNLRTYAFIGCLMIALAAAVLRKKMDMAEGKEDRHA